ncbi:MAG: Rrf2 family transcriptional regulator [Zymomonas sp.]|nr:MAG: Rrf2 family transcriptional regulator [Zymomonas sp.]
MRLTRQTNLAIRMLMYCAANSERLSQVSEIAAAYSVSAMHLAQISKPLVTAGLLSTVRGRNGGIKLGRPAGEITLADVIQAVETGIGQASDKSDRGTESAEEAEMEKALQAAFEQFLGSLRCHTIANLVSGMPDIRRLLNVA